ncbi:MAG: FG-GAP-like repeat-containing protein [Candidatus Neomarinimicrobiota bacterium]|nr:FG-GAP-like repeat-containing protein [Candidatus Neomarinimicrobiota bacterium]
MKHYTRTLTLFLFTSVLFGQPTFTTHVISDTADGANSVHVADVDADGDMDLLSSSSDDDKIAWCVNG